MNPSLPENPVVSTATRLAHAYTAAYEVIAREVGADPNNAQMSNAHFAALKAMELAAR